MVRCPRICGVFVGMSGRLSFASVRRAEEKRKPVAQERAWAHKVRYWEK